MIGKQYRRWSRINYDLWKTGLTAWLKQEYTASWGFHLFLRRLKGSMDNALLNHSNTPMRMHEIARQSSARKNSSVMLFCFHCSWNTHFPSDLRKRILIFAIFKIYYIRCMAKDLWAKLLICSLDWLPRYYTFFYKKIICLPEPQFS